VAGHHEDCPADRAGNPLIGGLELTSAFQFRSALCSFRFSAAAAAIPNLE